jgi:dihydrofolate reductase
MTRLTIIAAVARNGVIGHRGGMPWHLPGELAQFKATTLGHTLVMGRATFDSIGRALPGRRTIVFAQRLVITEVDAEPEGDTWFPSWARADWVEVSREVHDGWSRVVHERV